MDFDQTQALDEPWDAGSRGPKRQVAWVTVVSGSDSDIKKFPVFEGTTVLGRDPSCDICINSKKLSKTHAAVEVEDGSHFLHDMGSRNGTRFGDFQLKAKVRYEVTASRRAFVVGNVHCQYDIIATEADAGSDTEEDSGTEAPFVLNTEHSAEEVLVENSYDENCSEPVSTVPTSLAKRRQHPHLTSTPRSHQTPATEATLVLPESEQESSEEALHFGSRSRPRRILDSQMDSESPDIGTRRNVPMPRAGAAEPTLATQVFDMSATAAVAADETETETSAVADPTLATQVFDASTTATADPTQATQVFETSATADDNGGDDGDADTTGRALFEASTAVDLAEASTIGSPLLDKSAAEPAISGSSTVEEARPPPPPPPPAVEPTQATLEYDSDVSEAMLPADHFADGEDDGDDDDGGGDEDDDDPMDVTEPTVMLDDGSDATDGCAVSAIRAVTGGSGGADGEGRGDGDDVAVAASGGEGFAGDDAATLAYCAAVSDDDRHDDNDDATTGPEDDGTDEDSGAPGTSNAAAGAVAAAHDEEATLAYGLAAATATATGEDVDSDKTDDERSESPLAYCNPEEDEEPTQAYGLNPAASAVVDADAASDSSESEARASGGGDDEPTQAYGLDAAGASAVDDEDDAPTLGYALVAAEDDCEEPTQAYGLARADASPGSGDVPMAVGVADDDEPTQAYGLAGAGHVGAGGDADADDDCATQAYGIAAGAGDGEEPTMAYAIASEQAEPEDDVESQEYFAKVTGSGGAAAVAPALAVVTSPPDRATPPPPLTPATAAAQIVQDSQVSPVSPLKSCLPGLTTGRPQRGSKRRKHVLFASEAGGGDDGDDGDDDDDDDSSSSSSGAVAEAEAISEVPLAKRRRTSRSANVQPEAVASNGGATAAASGGRSAGSRVSGAAVSNADDGGSGIARDITNTNTPITRLSSSSSSSTATSANKSSARGKKSSVSSTATSSSSASSSGKNTKGQAQHTAAAKAAPPAAASEDASTPTASQGPRRKRRATADAAAAAAVTTAPPTDGNPGDSLQSSGDKTVPADEATPVGRKPRATKAASAAKATPVGRKPTADKATSGSNDASAEKPGACGKAASAPAGACGKAASAPASRSSRGAGRARMSESGDADVKTEEHGKDSEDMPRVMLTGIINEELRSVVVQLGGKMEDDNVRHCTHLVTDRIARTIKFLSCLAKGTPIVTTDWLYASKKAKHFVDHSRYAVHDAEKETTFKFDLEKSRKQALTRPLFDGQRLYLCASVKPPPDQMAEIVRCGGGEVLSTFPTKSSPDCIVVAASSDRSSINKCQQASCPVVSPEYILTGVLRQSTSVEEYQLPPAEDSTCASISKRKVSVPEKEKPVAKRGRRKR